jgi:thiamine kinase-like enzyme
MSVEQIIDNFNIPGDVTWIKPYGGGHINDTYQVHCQNATVSNYLLQKVNTYVFRDIVGLMNNFDLVTKHIRKKLIENNTKDVARRSLEVIKTKKGDLYQNVDGQSWRVLNFIEDHKVFAGATNPEIAYEGARMFGQFLTQLSDLDPSRIAETIPNFHNIGFRFDNFEKAIKLDSAGRVNLLKAEIKYVRSSHEIMSVIQNLGEKKVIPPRIVHNDTKINNVLFDQQNKGLCVIDLDTIMPGFVHFDFGDGIRTSANTGEEDDKDLKNVNYDLAIFEAFSAGYIESIQHILTEEELKSLAHAALLFPFIMGLRFLTDYISGDVYYKIKYKEHNLVRARAQFKLAQDGEAKLAEMQRIIKKLFSKHKNY